MAGLKASLCPCGDLVAAGRVCGDRELAVLPSDAPAGRRAPRVECASCLGSRRRRSHGAGRDEEAYQETEVRVFGDRRPCHFRDRRENFICDQARRTPCRKRRKCTDIRAGRSFHCWRLCSVQGDFLAQRDFSSVARMPLNRTAGTAHSASATCCVRASTSPASNSATRACRRSRPIGGVSADVMRAGRAQPNVQAL